MNPGYQNPGLVEPAGPDRSRRVASCRCSRADGRPLALLANYSLHYVGGVPPLSADYFGAFAERIAATARRPTRRAAVRRHHVQRHQRRHQQRQLRRPGRRQARSPASRSASSPTASPQAAHRRRTRRSSTATGCRWRWPRRRSNWACRLPSEEDVARAKEILAKAEEAGAEDAAARSTPARRCCWPSIPPKVKVKLQAIRVGDLGIVAIPCEVFVEIGLEIKKKSPLQADLHDRAGQRLQRLPADAGAARAGRLRDLAGAVELPGGGRLDRRSRRRCWSCCARWRGSPCGGVGRVKGIKNAVR